MSPKKAPKEATIPTRKSSRNKKEGAEIIIKPDTENEVSNTLAEETPEIALPSIEKETESGQEEESELFTPTTPTQDNTPNPTMANDPELSAHMSALLKRITQLEAGSKGIEDRGARGVTPMNSAFGGSDFKPTGFTALRISNPTERTKTHPIVTIRKHARQELTPVFSLATRRSLISGSSRSMTSLMRTVKPSSASEAGWP